MYGHRQMFGCPRGGRGSGPHPRSRGPPPPGPRFPPGPPPGIYQQTRPAGPGWFGPGPGSHGPGGPFRPQFDWSDQSGIPHRGMKRHSPFNYPANRQQKRQRDTSEKPGAFNYFCDTCDKGFKTDNKYEQHIAEHQKCNVEGCPYIAAPKLVKLHFNLQHRSGLAKKIWQLESKQDIEKWKAERRKNYPTAANIAKKSSAQDLKVQRGQVLNNQYFGKMRGRNKYSRGKRQRGGYQQMNGGDIRVNDVVQKDDVDKPRDAKDDPLSYLLDKDSADSDNNEDIVSIDNKPAGLQFAGGLGCLAAAYGSDSDDEEKESASETKNKIPKEDVTQVQHRGRPKVKKQQSKNRGCKLPAKQKSTLLQKLLAPDIRHERNVIFQCIRHVVRKNFYGLENVVKSEPNEEPDTKTDFGDRSCEKIEVKTEIHDEEIWDDAF